MDVQLLLVGGFQDKVCADRRPAGSCLTRVGLDFSQLARQRNDFRLDRLTCDTRRVAYASLGMGHRRGNAEKHYCRDYKTYSVSHDDSPRTRVHAGWK